MQQKDMYEQRKEMDMLKEENKRLTHQLTLQKEKIDALERHEMNTNEGHAKGSSFTSPTWTQVLQKGDMTRTRHQSLEIEKIPSKKTTEENLDAQEQLEREKKQFNVVISGVDEEENENARSLKGKIQGLFQDHFDMSEVPIEGAHRVGKKKDDKRPKLIVCTIMDAQKRKIILDNNNIYLKWTNMQEFYRLICGSEGYHTVLYLTNQRGLPTH